VGRHAPYYKWFPKDFAADSRVIAMDNMQELIYRRLLDRSWELGSLPADPGELARLAGVSPRAIRKAWVFPLTECWELTGDERLINHRLEEERENFTERSSKSTAAVKQRWSKRRKRLQTKNRPYTDVLPTQYDPDPDPDPEVKNSSGSAEPARSESPPTQLELAELANFKPSVQWLKLDERIFMLPEEEGRLRAYVEREAKAKGLCMLTENEWRESEAHLNRDLVIHRERRGPRTLPGLVRNHFIRALWVVNRAQARASPNSAAARKKRTDDALKRVMQETLEEERRGQ